MAMENLQRPLATVFIVPLTEFLVGVCLFIALLFGQQELALLALLVLGITIGTRLWSRLSLSGIICASMVDKQKLFPGESFGLRLSAQNAKFLPVWLQISVPFEDTFDPVTGEMHFSCECGLLWYQQVRFNRKLVARRRGVYRVGPPRMRIGDLFGFFPREKRTAGDIHIIVYPRLVPLRPFFPPSREFFGVPGARTPVKDPIYILGTRDYQHGRPARHIHWKASARHHRLQEKVFEPSEQKKVLLAVEVSQFAKAGAAENFERTLEVAGSLAVQSDQRSYALGFVTNGVVDGGPSVLPIGRSPQQLPAILEILARLKMRATGPLADIMRRALKLPWGVSGVLFAHKPDEETQAMAQIFSHRGIPMIFVMCASRGTWEQNGQTRMFGLDELRIEESQTP
jgi:uncharacterized protein (DUF58 family)